MTEIDKIVNQAFPDELRRVQPIPVDEEKILARTFEKLGLEKAPAPQPVKARRGRYVQRHSLHREEEPTLVAVAIEPARPMWRALVGWALAACLVLACGIGFGPTFLRSLPWEKTSGVMAGGAPPQTAGGPETIAEGGAELAPLDGADQGSLSGSAAPDVQKRDAAEKEKSRHAVLNALYSGADTIFYQGGDIYNSDIHLTAISSEPGRVTVIVCFPYYTADEVGKFEIELLPVEGPLRVHIASRENSDGYATVTFALSDMESDYVNADLLIKYLNDGYPEVFLGFEAFIDTTGQDECAFSPFGPEKTYFYLESYGYLSSGYDEDATDGSAPVGENETTY
ncbi:MAG: hypothetical protein HFE94_02690 [Acutalibacter sp.]|nr:hypothetical protein [Acutalibacter sp.]